MLGLGWPELLLIGIVGFFIFGPERLPTLARDAARVLKQLRAMADGASAELRSQLPSASEFGLDEVRSLRDLHPKAMIGRALFDDEAGPDLFGDRQAARAASTNQARGGGGHGVGGGGGGGRGAAGGAAPSRKESFGQLVPREAGAPPPYDLDAT
jgi:sec-independent protein translocase protein TatB